MVYLIESAAYRRDTEGRLKLFLILKIGYAADDKCWKRYQDSLTQNPTCKILYTIPKANIEHETKIQKLFNKLIVPKEILEEVNTREWYWYNNSILNFFEDIKNVNDLEEKLKIYTKPEEKINKYDIKELLEIKEKLKKLENPNYKKENNLQNISENIDKIQKISDIKILLDLLELEDPGITEKIIKYIDLKEDELKFLDNFEKLTIHEKRLDLIYSGMLKNEQLENILELIPNNYSSHYYLIGKRKLMDLGKPEIINETVEYKKKLEKEIYDIFNSGEIYTQEELENNLKICHSNIVGRKVNKVNIEEIKEFFSIIDLNNGKYKLL